MLQDLAKLSLHVTKFGEAELLCYKVEEASKREILMIVTRWQAPIMPDTEEMKLILAREGLDAQLEVSEPDKKMGDHRHPFTEIRVVLSGEMIFTIAGNQMLLRPGDRIEVPSNTRHAHHAQGQTRCECLVAQRVC